MHITLIEQALPDNWWYLAVVLVVFVIIITAVYVVSSR
jgi:hypothetical protein